MMPVHNMRDDAAKARMKPEKPVFSASFFYESPAKA